MAEVDEILLGFVEEMEGYIPALHEGAGELRAHPDNRPELDEMRRLVHIVRGAAAMLGVEPLSRAAKSMEQALDHVREGEAVLSGETLDALEDTTGVFERYAAHLSANGAEPNQELAGLVDELCERIEALPLIEAPSVDAARVSDMNAMDALNALFATDPAPAGDAAPAMTAAGVELDEDLIASFNEEVEEHFGAVNAALLRLGERVTGPMPLDEGAREALRDIRRAVHTVGGASTLMGKWQLADIGHRLEEALDRCSGEAAEIGPERMETLALALDQFETLARRPADFDLAVMETALNELGAAMPAGETVAAPAVSAETALAGDALFADGVAALAPEAAPAGDTLTLDDALFADAQEPTPALTEETPAFAEAETALFDEAPAFADEAPAFAPADEAPAFVEEEAALFADAEEVAPAEPAPAPAGDMLTLDDEVLAATEEAPAFTAETEEPAAPAIADEAPAFVEEETALFADTEPAPVAPAPAGDMLTLDEAELAAAEEAEPVAAAPVEEAPAFVEEEAALFADAEEPAPIAPAPSDDMLTLDDEVLAATEEPSAFTFEAEEPAAPAIADEAPAFVEEETALFADTEEPAPVAPAPAGDMLTLDEAELAAAEEAEPVAVTSADEAPAFVEEEAALFADAEEPAPAPASADDMLTLDEAELAAAEEAEPVAVAPVDDAPAFAEEEAALFADTEEPGPAPATSDDMLTLDEAELAAAEEAEPVAASADEAPAFVEEEAALFADTEEPAPIAPAPSDDMLTLDEAELAAAEEAEPVAAATVDEAPAFVEEEAALFADAEEPAPAPATSDDMLTLDEAELAAAEEAEPVAVAPVDEVPAFVEEEAALFADAEEPAPIAPAPSDDMLTLDEAELTNAEEAEPVDAAPVDEAPAFVEEEAAVAEGDAALAADEDDAVLTLDEETLAAEAEADTALAAEADEEEDAPVAAADPDMLDVNKLFAADAPAGMVEDQPADDFLAAMGAMKAKPEEEAVQFTDADAEEMEEELFGSATVDELFPTRQPEAADDADALLDGDAGSAEDLLGAGAAEDLFGATPDDAFPDAGFGMADADFDDAAFEAPDALAAAEAEPSGAAATPMTAAGFELDDELLEGFKEEADEHFTAIATSLAALGNLVEETTPMSEAVSEELRGIRRAVHTVKGASAVLGMQHIADVGHRIEDVLDWFYEDAGEIGPDQMATLSGVLDQFENLVRRPEEFDAAVVDAGLAELRAGMDAAPKSAPTPVSAAAPAATPSEPAQTAATAATAPSGTVAAPAGPTMTAAGIELDDELLESFTEEVNEHFETIEGSLATLGNLVEETVPMDETISEELRGIRRAVHTVKGASAVLGLQHIADVGHRIEDALDWFYEEAGEIGPEQMATLSLVLDQFENLVRTPDNYDASVVDQGLAALHAWMGDAAPKAASAPAAPVEAAPATPASAGTVAAPTAPTMTAGGFELDEELLASFTEEVNEHFETIANSLTTLGNLVEETVPMDETIGEELRAVRRAVHTVKGASAVIGLQHIADVGHRIEDVLDWFYEEAKEIGPEQMATLSLVLDQFENLVRAPENYEASVVDQGLAALHAWMGDAAPAPKPVSAPTAPAPEPAFAAEPEAAAEDAGSMSAALFSEEEQEMLRAGFMEEAEEHLNDVSRVLHEVENRVAGPTPMDAELKEELREIRRSVHTIKGASAVIGLNDISGYAHKVEDFLDWLFEDAETTDPDTVSLLAESLDLLDSVVKDPASVAEERKQDIYARLNAARGLAAEAAPAAPAAAPAAPVAAPTAWRLEEEEPEPLTEQEIEQLRHSFAEEADLHIASLHQSVQFLSGHISGTAPPPAVLEETGRMYELLLSLRKDARILGNGDVYAFAGMLAGFLGWARTGAVAVSPALLDALGDSVDVLDQLMEDPDLVNWERIDDVSDKLENLRKHAIPPEPAPAGEPAPAFADIAPALEDLPAAPADMPASPVDLPAAGAAPAPEAPKAAADEAAKTIRIHQNQLDRFINLANELLVGVSGFDRNMGRFQEALDELDLAARRLKDIAMELETKFEVKALGEITDHFDRIRDEAREIKADIRNLAEFDSLELDHYTQLNLIIRALNESAIDVSALQTTLVGIRSGLRGDINRQHRTVRELQVRLMDARLSPMSILTPRLSRTMRDAASRLKKRVRLVTEGDTVELDRLIWEKLADPFMHMVRNSIDHGIESPEERAAAGKPAIATIRVKGEREGNHVMIRFSDDGRGLNLEAIRERARRDLGDEADDLEREQLIDLIFDNGFSVKQEVTQVSGRGVGMDVVKQNILDLQGSITVDTETGRGTEFAIRVPLTLGLVRVLLVEVERVMYGIPITEIREVRRVPRAEIDEARRTFLRGGERAPLYDLAQLLLREEVEEDEHEVGPIIFTILTERGPVGIRIPRIAGQNEVVIKSLGSHLRAVTGIAGAAVMGDGSVIPLLNMDELLAAYLIQGMPQMVQVRPEAEKARPLTVMIVDDSISIRRVMSRLVANHGWVPVECKDGQDAFEKLDTARPDCILLDIEMPRMNGFEFLTIKANLPDHKDIPVIMLTSRSSDKHRNKAFELGASMFLNKPSKDEDLVEAVLGLTGHAGDRFSERMAEVAS